MRHEISLKDIFIRFPAIIVAMALVAMAAPESWRGDAILFVSFIAVYGGAGLIGFYIVERSMVILMSLVILSFIGLVI